MSKKEKLDKALKIREKIQAQDQPDLVASYLEVALAAEEHGEYSLALLSHQKVLALREETLAPDHPDLVEANKKLDSIKALMK
jgi:hypothetical protein